MPSSAAKGSPNRSFVKTVFFTLLVGAVVALGGSACGGAPVGEADAPLSAFERGDDYGETVSDEPPSSVDDWLPLRGRIVEARTVGHSMAKVSFAVPADWTMHRVYHGGRVALAGGTTPVQEGPWEWVFRHESGLVRVVVYRYRKQLGANRFEEQSVGQLLGQHRDRLEETYDVDEVQVPLVLARRMKDVLHLADALAEEPTFEAIPIVEYVGGALPQAGTNAAGLPAPYDTVFGSRHATLAGRARIGRYGEYAQHNDNFMCFVEAASNVEPGDSARTKLDRRTIVVEYVFARDHFAALKYQVRAFRESVRFIVPG